MKCFNLNLEAVHQVLRSIKLQVEAWGGGYMRLYVADKNSVFSKYLDVCVNECALHDLEKGRIDRGMKCFNLNLDAARMMQFLDKCSVEILGGGYMRFHLTDKNSVFSKYLDACVKECALHDLEKGRIDRGMKCFNLNLEAARLGQSNRSFV